jgi:hypothetical protein
MFDVECWTLPILKEGHGLAGKEAGHGGKEN